ncbi:MAG: rhodanese-like domain-containing protein [Bacteroidaceae bacterium]|nr:rhodanese-like domain-containing protein [Bacteroidaceae bacterium]
MKKYILPLLFFVMIVLNSCVEVNSGSGSFKRLSVAEFKEFISDSTVQLVDVRTPEEHLEGHIPGSLNIDVNKGHEELAAVLDPERPVALYCRSGRRSKNAGFVLEAVFFKNVVDLEGGYNAWVEYHSNAK